MTDRGATDEERAWALANPHEYSAAWGVAGAACWACGRIWADIIHAPGAPKIEDALPAWIVWVEGCYGSSVTNKQTTTAIAAVLWCARYAVEHAGSAEAVGQVFERVWCVAPGEIAPKAPILRYRVLPSLESCEPLPALPSPRCSTCKHHSTAVDGVVGVRDVPLRLNEDGGDMGLCDHEERSLYTCLHPEKRETDRAQGYWPAEEGVREPGADCPLFVPGKRGKVSSHLERLLAQAAERAEKDERRGQ